MLLASTAPVVGAVAAEIDPAAVQAVVVRAERPPVQILPDRKVYAIGQDLQSATGSAADVLNQIPSLNVDADGVLSLRGDAQVIVLVDGKPSAQFSGPTGGTGLLQYPASEIERIEVLTNPPAQYKVDGVGVINIVTRHTHRPGPSGALRLSVGDRRRFTAAATGAWNLDRLSFNGTASLRQDDKQRVVSSLYSITDPVAQDVVANAESLKEHLRRLSPLLKGGVEVRPTNRLTLGLDLSHGETEGDRFFDQHNTSGVAGGPLASITDRHSDGHEWRTEGSQKLTFEQVLGSSDETLSASLQRSVVRERERYAYLNRHTLPVTADSRDHLNLSLDLITVDLSVDYVRPMGKDRTLKLGYDLQDDANDYDNFGDTVDPVSGSAIVNPLITDHFRYHQQLNAAYASYTTPVGPWTMQAGLRLEQAAIDIHLITGEIRGAQSYFRFYPTLNLERSLSEENRVNLSAGRRVSRPDAEHFNPFTDNQDILNLRAGNPRLLPRDTVAIDLGYVHEGKGLTYSLTAYGRFNRDAESDLTRAISDTVKLTTFVNVPRSRSGGLEFSANGKLWPKLSYAVSGNLFYSEINASSLVGGAVRGATGLDLKASFDWRPTAVDTFQLTSNRYDGRLIPQGRTRAISIVNLGYRRQVGADLAVVATLADLFDGQGYTRIVHDTGLDSTWSRRQLGRIAYVGVVWTLGAPKKAKTPGFDYDQ